MTAAPARRREPRVALATCAELPATDEDSALLLPALRACGIEASAAIWTEPGVDWRAFDLVMVRSCWDYAPQRDAFVAWSERVPHLANSAAAMRWNTDKRYLRELQARSVRVVATEWIEDEPGWRNAPHSGEWVVKPAISAAAVDTHRFAMHDATEHRAALDHVSRLRAAGRVVMLQPYMHAIDVQGETSLMYVDGQFSHAVRRDPVLGAAALTDDERRLLPACGLDVRACEATSAELALAKTVLDAVPAEFKPLLYARIDMVPGADGAPQLMELEITEPELFLRLDAQAPARYARAMQASLAARSVPAH